MELKSISSWEIASKTFDSVNCALCVNLKDCLLATEAVIFSATYVAQRGST